MELIPYRNNRGVGTLQRQMNRLFDDFFGENNWPGLWNRSEWSPLIDVSENAEELVLTAEVPGIRREDLDISVTGNMLTLKGEKRSEHEEHEGNSHRVERSFGSFSRSISLPGSVDPGAVQATMKDGVLRLRLPKREEAKPRQIDVKVE